VRKSQFLTIIFNGAQWGYYTDGETGLLLLTNRYYDAGTGRFLNRDPIGYAGGINLYGYVGNGPTSFADPLGLFTQQDAFVLTNAVIGGAAGAFVCWGNPLCIAAGAGLGAAWAQYRVTGDAGAAAETGVTTFCVVGTLGAAAQFGSSYLAYQNAVPPLYRFVNDEEAGLIQGAEGAIGSKTAPPFPIGPTTRVFPGSSLPRMYGWADFANTKNPGRYTNLVTFTTSSVVPQHSPDAPSFGTFYASVDQINRVLVGPPDITPLGQAH
jgi:RHS repeat-associated protein